MVSADIKVSIVILTFNQLDLTKECLKSIEVNTNVPYELILVDNASTDGTPEYLEKYCGNISGKCISKRLIKNQHNIGFAPGVNQGLDICQGEYVCLLNNDTVVTQDWIVKLIDSLENDEKAEIVGPVSTGTFYPQYVENEESIDGIVRESNILYGFCEVFRRELLFKIGCLDERYRIGNFEDHDFNERILKNNGKLLVAGNVFIEHHCHKSWKSKVQLDYTTVKNQKKFDEKWGFLKRMESDTDKQKYYQCENGVVVLIENDRDYKNITQRLDESEIQADEIVVVDTFTSGDSIEKFIENKSKEKRIIRVKVPKNHNLSKKGLYEIGINNSFSKKQKLYEEL